MTHLQAGYVSDPRKRQAMRLARMQGYLDAATTNCDKRIYSAAMDTIGYQFRPECMRELGRVVWRWALMLEEDVPYRPAARRECWV